MQRMVAFISTNEYFLDSRVTSTRLVTLLKIVGKRTCWEIFVTAITFCQGNAVFDDICSQISTYTITT